jgi:putative ABC transport system permease protein
VKALVLARLMRSPISASVRVLTLAAAVGLVGAMLLFVGHSLQTMTRSAARGVPLDWQAPVASYGAARRVARALGGQPGVRASAAAATAPVAGLEHHSAAGTIRAGAGAILAVPPRYFGKGSIVRLLRGRLDAGGIVLDQQLAATLQAQPGDTILLEPRPGTGPRRFRVSGVALVGSADILFQPLIPLLGPAPAQPPANIVIAPLSAFERRIAPALPAASDATTGTVAPGTPSGVQWQVQAQVDPRALSGSPSHALQEATRLRNRLERTLPGRTQFVDNLADGLSSAAGDALYAETLYIMLAVPGAIVALGLAYLAALGTAERDRQELALLRARGARRRDLLALACLEAAVVGAAAGAVGTGAAVGAIHLAGVAGGAGWQRAAVTFGICAVLAFLGAVAARLAATAGALRTTVAEARQPQPRPTRPLWQRIHLDLVALAVAGLVYWLTARTGFSAVVNPDSNPTLSLSVYMFLAPALLWIGAALLLVRLRGRAFAWLVRRAGGRRATGWRGFQLVSADRRAPAINRGLVLVGLLLAFGVELGLFSATYDQQARVDAQLTLGADVVVTAPPSRRASSAVARLVASTPGVDAVSAVDHSYAYVGPDLQDIFGIDTRSIARATGLRDSYFLGGGAGEMLARLRARPDAVLVSRETVTDYSLALGDLLRLRVYDHARGRFRVVPFHVAGIVQEFPAAPRDSFMVANLAYLEHAGHDPGPNVSFVRAAGDPVGLAHRLAALTRALGTNVRNIREQAAQTVSSITTVSLAGVTRIEEGFTLLLAAAAMALFTAVSLVERRREFATMAALGASLRRVATFLWFEAALVVAAAVALAAVLGWALAEMLVAMLQHVFDPPPDHLAAPWPFLAGLAASAVAGCLVAVALASRAIARMPLGAILRET